jgi:integrase
MLRRSRICSQCRTWWHCSSSTGVRVGELEAATCADLDEHRRAWLVRAAVSKTRRSRWVEIPPDLFEAVVDRLPAREDRAPSAPVFGVTADRLRMAVGRACRDAGVPRFGPHALRHRRVSLLHRQGVDWATIGAIVGQRSKLVTADTYTHAVIDGREVDRVTLLERVRRSHTVTPQVSPRDTEKSPLAAHVLGQYRPRKRT